MESGAISVMLARLAPKLGARRPEIQDLARLSGGASQETWAFNVETAGGHKKAMVLRRCPHDGPRNQEALGLSTEAGLLASAQACGVAVPDIIYVCKPDDGLGEAFIMAFIAGETLARKILRNDNFSDARLILAGQCGTALAKIHAMPHDNALPFSNGLDQLTRYADLYRSFEVNRPILELAFKWLTDTAPQPIDLTMVHGDFRNGNLIVGEDGLRAVLDWELAHIGDPREDLGWICVNSWRFGQRQKPVGGFGTLSQCLGAYEQAGGAAFAPKDIAWFQALGSLKWAIMCLIMYQAFKTGSDPSIERAMIGRRTSEAEIDLLNLMEAREYA